MKNLLKAYLLLDAAERRQAGVILAVVTVMAFFDTLGTVSVMPFLAVTADPSMIHRSHGLSWLYDSLGFSQTQSFLFFLGVTAFGLLLVSALLRAGGQYLVNRFNELRAYSIGRRLLETYLRQPYSFFLTHHTGDLSKGLLSEIAMLVAQIYQPATTLVAQGALLIVLLTLLLAVNPTTALVGIAVLGACYMLIYATVRRYIAYIGHQRIDANRERFRVVGESLGGIKTVKILGRESYYLDRFDRASLRLARHQASATTLSVVPRYAIEAVAFGGIILLTLSLLVRYAHSPNGAMGNVLPLLGLYAFAGYRIMPALQAIYQSLAQLRYGAATLESIMADLEGRDDLPELPRKFFAPLPFFEQVELKRIGFRHEGAPLPSLSGIDLVLPKGSTLGIVGSTGAGKTTLVDVFLGLLTPDEGRILLDGVPVTAETLRRWQAGIGYVPQDIFLVDASVAENIALGCALEEIDLEKVRDCARMAQILDFIEADLPQGFDTLVGERGVRLSGGQRQRIGIARALYRDPSIIVFDEATSALDNITEKDVMSAIDALGGTRTILIIAHRISTVVNCDQILVLERGRVVGRGHYDELYHSNPAFRQLVDARAVA